jgi:hypothetical protein
MVMDVVGTVTSGGLFGSTSKLVAVATERAGQWVVEESPRAFPDVWLVIQDLAALRAAVAARDPYAIVAAFRKLLQDLGMANRQVHQLNTASAALRGLTWAQWIELGFAGVQLVAAVRARDAAAILAAVEHIAAILGIQVA